MEGCAFAVYDNLAIAEEHGVHVSEYLGSGGATQSAVWCQIKADIYGSPFIVARRADGGEGGHSLGLFALTAYGVGLVRRHRRVRRATAASTSSVRAVGAAPRAV